MTLGKLKARAKKPDRTARSPLVSNRDIKGISVRDSDDSDDVLVEWAAIGAAVLAAQRIEFLLYGIIAHGEPELKETDRRSRHLTPESFLRGEVTDLRGTLGLLAKAYGTRLRLSVDDLEAFVKNRNLIVHNYWRLCKASIRDGQTLENPMAFLREFLDDCQRWEGILRGDLAAMRLSAAVASGGELQPALTPNDLDYMILFGHHARSHRIRKSQ